MTEDRPRSVGLGGDGDEIAAIEEVERVFGVGLDYDDAPRWATAGDVYTSLCNALPAEEIELRGGWSRFVQALTDETGVDSNEISADSPLLSDSRFPIHVSDANALLFKVIAISAFVVLALALW
jgi:hypothetical protein